MLKFVQLAVEYEQNVTIVKVDTDDEYEFARDMQVIMNLFSFAMCTLTNTRQGSIK